MKIGIWTLAAAMVIVLLTRTASAGTLRVVDGDTLEIGNVTYRLYGVDAPEAGQSCMTVSEKTWPCGKVAIRHLEQLIIGTEVKCDNRGTDGYGRTLAVCLAKEIDLSARLVETGLAWAFRKYASEYVQREDVAREKRIGIWQADTETPWDFRAHKWEAATQEAPEGCPIKGNISKNGHIYHTPWSPWYTRTSINSKRGERWFCDETEALNAGWKAPHWGQ